MNFLKKFAAIVLQVGRVVLGVAPMVQQYIPAALGFAVQKGVDGLNQIAALVQTAEVMFAAIHGPDAKTGAQKLQAASPLAQQVVLRILAAGRKVVDTPRFERGCQLLTSGVAEILSSLEPKVVELAPEEIKYPAEIEAAPV